MNDQTLKWLVEQSDRGLFILALAVGGWFIWKVLKRSEAQTDAQNIVMQEKDARYAAAMAASQAQILANCEKVSHIVALNTVATERNNRLLEKMEQKL
jgi:hypothetical protein